MKNRIDSTKIPHSEYVEFISGPDRVSTWLEIVQNTVVDLLDIDVFIERLYVECSDRKGFVDLAFSIPSTTDCSIDRLSIENWSENLDDILSDLQTMLITEWNK